MKFILGKTHFVHEFHVVENFKRSVLLGIDFSIENKATLDFRKRSLGIGGQVVLLKGKQVDTDCFGTRTWQTGFTTW